MIKSEILITVGTGLAGQFGQIESALSSARANQRHLGRKMWY